MSNNRLARAVLMVRPTSFGFDEQTAKTNAFQNKPTISTLEIRNRANDEFQRVVATLSSHGIEVISFEDDAIPAKPNAVFPNNWMSTWSNGRIFLYPMATESRRIERNSAIIQSLKHYFQVSEVIDLSGSEKDGHFLESTGVMIFDHAHKIVYGCISVRCDETLLNKHAKALGYTPVIFHAYTEDGIAIYHTNILMGVQTSTAVVCLEAVRDLKERERLVRSLEATGHDIIDISYTQMSSFCANILELRNQDNERFLALSRSAYDNFTPSQRERLSKDKTLLPIDIPTIEAIGGGSVRCMLAEIFLKQNYLPPIVSSEPELLAKDVAL
jgi:hypothetical protein